MTYRFGTRRQKLVAALETGEDAEALLKAYERGRESRDREVAALKAENTTLRTEVVQLRVASGSPTP